MMKSEIYMFSETLLVAVRSKNREGTPAVIQVSRGSGSEEGGLVSGQGGAGLGGILEVADQQGLLSRLDVWERGITADSQVGTAGLKPRLHPSSELCDLGQVT